MEVCVTSHEGLPEDCILSVRLGATRRQGSIDALVSKPLKFPGGICAEPLKINVLMPIASAMLVPHPDSGTYRVGLETPSGSKMAVHLSMAAESKSFAPSSRVPVDSSQINSRDASACAREYLDKHGLLKYVQILLNAVIQRRPENPYEFMMQQLGAELGHKRTSEFVDAPATPMPEVRAASDVPVPPASGNIAKTGLAEGMPAQDKPGVLLATQMASDASVVLAHTSTAVPDVHIPNQETRSAADASAVGENDHKAHAAQRPQESEAGVANAPTLGNDGASGHSEKVRPAEGPSPGDNQVEPKAAQAAGTASVAPAQAISAVPPVVPPSQEARSSADAPGVAEGGLEARHAQQLHQSGDSTAKTPTLAVAAAVGHSENLRPVEGVSALGNPGGLLATQMASDASVVPAHASTAVPAVEIPNREARPAPDASAAGENDQKAHVAQQLHASEDDVAKTARFGTESAVQEPVAGEPSSLPDASLPPAAAADATDKTKTLMNNLRVGLEQTLRSGLLKQLVDAVLNKAPRDPSALNADALAAAPAPLGAPAQSIQTTSNDGKLEDLRSQTRDALATARESGLLEKALEEAFVLEGLQQPGEDRLGMQDSSSKDAAPASEVLPRETPALTVVEGQNVPFPDRGADASTTKPIPIGEICTSCRAAACTSKSTGASDLQALKADLASMKEATQTLNQRADYLASDVIAMRGRQSALAKRLDSTD